MVHCTAAGPEPPVLASGIFTLTAPPGPVLSAPTHTATCCAIAWLVAPIRNIQANLENNLLVGFKNEYEMIMKSLDRLSTNTRISSPGVNKSCFAAGTRERAYRRL